MTSYQALWTRHLVHKQIILFQTFDDIFQLYSMGISLMIMQFMKPATTASSCSKEIRRLLSRCLQITDATIMVMIHKSSSRVWSFFKSDDWKALTAVRRLLITQHTVRNYIAYAMSQLDDPTKPKKETDGKKQTAKPAPATVPAGKKSTPRHTCTHYRMSNKHEA